MVSAKIRDESDCMFKSSPELLGRQRPLYFWWLPSCALSFRLGAPDGAFMSSNSFVSNIMAPHLHLQ